VLRLSLSFCELSCYSLLFSGSFVLVEKRLCFFLIAFKRTDLHPRQKSSLYAKKKMVGWKPKVQAGSSRGRPKRGKSVSVSRKEFIPAIRSPESSRTMSAQALCPPSGLGRYWPKAGEPQAAIGSKRDLRQPEPIPSIQVRIDSGPWSQSS